MQKWIKISYPEKSKLIHTAQIKDQYIDITKVIAMTQKDDGGVTLQFKGNATLFIEAVASSQVIEYFKNTLLNLETNSEITPNG